MTRRSLDRCETEARRCSDPGMLARVRNRDVLLRIDAHFERGNELMAEIRGQHELNRREHELNRHEHERSNAVHLEVLSGLRGCTDAIRALTVEIRENTALLRDLRHGIQASNEGLMRVLDELRRRDDEGPAAAGA